MSAKFVILACCVAASVALPLVSVEPESAAHYEFQYSVQDPHTGDEKQQQESRAGDSVTGSYSLLQPDGVRRVVHYSADHHNGFNAQVSYEGHPTPAPAKIAYAPVAQVAYHHAPVYAAPVAKVTYAAAPVAKVTYAAPVAKVTYAAAPVAKVTYAAPVTHVSYSSPIIAYHH